MTKFKNWLYFIVSFFPSLLVRLYKNRLRIWCDKSNAAMTIQFMYFWSFDSQNTKMVYLQFKFI